MNDMKTAPSFSREFYADDASAYYKTLPMEHFMESVSQSQQRKITLTAFDAIAKLRPEIHCFNELLIQYPIDEAPYFKRVCPDNMVIIHDGPINADGSYALSHQPARPFLVIEYISKRSEFKDREDNYSIYERELRVPYYLLCHPEEEDLILFKLRPRKLEYATIKPDDRGCYAIPELELEVVMHDGWLRYLFRGDFLEMFGELYVENKEVKAKNIKVEAERDREREQRLAAEAENERLRALLASLGGDPAASSP